jgi:hypothetical protein
MNTPPRPANNFNNNQVPNAPARPNRQNVIIDGIHPYNMYINYINQQNANQNHVVGGANQELVVRRLNFQNNADNINNEIIR